MDLGGILAVDEGNFIGFNSGRFLSSGINKISPFRATKREVNPPSHQVSAGTSQFLYPGSGQSLHANQCHINSLRKWSVHLLDILSLVACSVHKTIFLSCSLATEYCNFSFQNYFSNKLFVYQRNPEIWCRI